MRARWKWTMAAVLACGTVWATPPDDDDEPAAVAPKVYSFDALQVEGALMSPSASMAELGATPGGAQDIGHARDRIAAGEVPHANTFTPEGLFSEHDLPLSTGRACARTLCLDGAATRADLIAQPEVRSLAQLAFASGLDPKTWRRRPVNLVAVVDKSGSMSGSPLETVRASLHALVEQLGPRDQLSIVLYGDRAHVHLKPTSLTEAGRIRGAIDRIASAGSTAMEAGLSVGFDLAQRSADGFEGGTRVMLFTDERPNVGATHAGSFMAMARDASRRGVGLTTVGVGTHFGAELAGRISSVRGGNLFFFPDPGAMAKTFGEALDTMLTELAFDLRLTVTPAAGQRIVGLYGIPGDLVKRTKNGGFELGIETVFLSRKRGAIYLAFAPEPGALPTEGALGHAAVSYETPDGVRHTDRVAFAPWTRGPLPLGLARGVLLVDEVTTLKQAARLHLEHNDQEGAWRLVRTVRARIAHSGVPGMAPELETLTHLEHTLARLSGHHGEPGGAFVARDPVSGLPR